MVHRLAERDTGSQVVLHSEAHDESKAGTGTSTEHICPAMASSY